MTDWCCLDTILALAAQLFSAPAGLRAVRLSSGQMAVFDHADKQSACICVALGPDGPRLAAVHDEPVPGFLLSDGGTLLPARAVRGAARIVVTPLEIGERGD